MLDDWDAQSRRDQARQTQRARERAQGGLRQRRKAWPAEEAELYRLEQAEALADADYEYRKADPRAVFDTAGDRGGVQGGGRHPGPIVITTRQRRTS